MGGDGSGFYLSNDEGANLQASPSSDLRCAAWQWLETPEGDVEEVDLLRRRARPRLARERQWLFSRAPPRRRRAAPTCPSHSSRTGDVPPCCACASHSGGSAALIWQGAERPPELYVIDLGHREGAQLTQSMLGGLRPRQLVQPELVSYPTFDGREVPGLAVPAEAARAGCPSSSRSTAGPNRRSGPLYMPLYQYLLSRGIAVLATNIRGSSGYGKTYQTLIHHDWGGGDLRDWDAAVKWLHEQDWVNRDRIARLGRLLRRLRRPVVRDAAARLLALRGRHLRAFEPGDVRAGGSADLEALHGQVGRESGHGGGFPDERSPITYVEQMKTPLLVIQGATDPRVVKPESDQMVERLQSLGREVEYEVFEDEGHGFTRRSNELRAFRLSADWLEKYLT